MNNFEILKKIIKNSNLDSLSKKLMLDFWQKVKDENLAPVIKLFEEDPSWINKIYQNIKLKEKALKEGDGDLWNNILKEEEKILSGLE